MIKAETLAGVERKRESYNFNKKQAKRLALLSISKADYKHESV